MDALDDEVGGVETLGVGVGLSVLEEVDEELGGLDGPAGLADTELLALSSATLTTGETAHGDGHALVLDVVKVGKSLLEVHAADGLGSLAGVLERNTEVRAPSAGALRVGDIVGGVTDL